jgi:signal transduction histidine kinase
VVAGEQGDGGAEFCGELLAAPLGVGTEAAEVGRLQSEFISTAQGVETFEALQQLVLEVNAGVEQVRNFARMLVPVELASGGLAAGLAPLGREMETVFNIVCRVEVAEDVPVPTLELSLAMYRIAQEAARNAVQHGRAKEVEIVLTSDAYTLRLRVANEGRSWDPDRATGAGLGLRIMRHRAASVWGTFVIHATADGRTEAVCRIPHGPREKGQRTMISQ